MKSLVCLPSPKISNDSLSLIFLMNFVITPAYSGDCQSPNMLKNLRITESILGYKMNFVSSSSILAVLSPNGDIGFIGEFSVNLRFSEPIP